ncbi:MAG: hypothetical protein AAB448_00350 [Patescibacteria group bacterium]
MEERRNFFKEQSSVVQLSFAGAAFLLLLTGYIMQVNASSTKAYALRDATLTYEELLRSQDRLAAEVDRLRSLSSVMERKAFLDLVPVGEITYITVNTSDTVAIK